MAVIIWLRAAQAHLWLLLGDLANVESWLETSGLHIDEELTQDNGYGQLIHAQLLGRQGDYASAERLLQRLLEHFPMGLRIEPVVRLMLPYAHTLYAQGKVNQAIQSLRKALQLAAPEGYVRPFLEHGPDLFTLLTLVGQSENISREIQQHIARLLSILGSTQADIPVMTPVQLASLATAASVSQREQELLSLVARGLSNREIANRLFITQNTVKSHLRRIYLKLEVGNRTQAVAQARALDLL